MQVLLLRLDAPLMSFGGVVVDQKNPTDSFPYRAMLTGLFANALGLCRSDEAALTALQARLRYAARRDRVGTPLVDFHTVDFSAEGSMASDLAWTTRGELEERKGGTASEGTHIRERHYIADGIVTVAVSLDPPDEAPSLTDLEQALRFPARPLFIGRACCIPSAPIGVGQIEAPSLKSALDTTPRPPSISKGRPRADEGPLPAVWPRQDGYDERSAALVPRVEDRDWANAVHVGRRILVEGLVDPPFAEAAGES